MFNAKVVFITGASSGIGAALAREFARQGALLVLTARRLDLLDALAAELQTRTLTLALDVRDEAALQAAVQQAVEHFGGLDVMIANAGYGVVARFDELSQDDYRRQFETNVFGVLATARAALPELRKSRGQLVLMGSVAGHLSAAGSTPYSMSKFAVRALADGLRAEWFRDGVGVTLITPGFVESDIRKLDNQGQLRSNKDPIPKWLLMPVAPAAREMVAAIARRQGEVIISGHGKLFVFLSRHFSGLTRWLQTRVSRGKDKRLTINFFGK